MHLIPPPSETKYRRARILNVILGAVVVFLALVVAAQLLSDKNSIAANSSSTPQASPPAADGAGGLDVARRDPRDSMAIGDIDAPVVLIEWTDLRCPYCALFSRETLPTLIAEYVDTGMVRIEFHDVAFFGQQSEDAAVAARAAANQGKFVEFVTAIYQAAPEGTHPDLPRENLIAFAAQAGVPDAARFASDLDEPELRTAAAGSTRSAQQLGVNSVPFFLAGESAVAGAQSIDAFRRYLDSALDKAK